MFGCPGGPAVENMPVSAGDTGLISEPGRSHMLRSNQACVMYNYGSLHLKPMLCTVREATAIRSSTEGSPLLTTT